MLNKYPAWKNLLILFIVLVGVLYSVPNLYSDDPAIQFSHAFEGAGWGVRAESRTYATQIIYGLFIPGPETAEVLTVRSAFGEVGISFRTDDLPTPAVTYSSGGDEGRVLIMVGSKNPPF